MRLVLLAASLMTLASCSGTCSGTASPTPSPTPHPVATPVADASCQAEVQSRSLNSDTPTSFTISNHTPEALSLFWLNFQGQRVKYFDLGPGETRTQATFVTHPWVVADPKGTCIRLFLVTAPAQVTI